MYESKLNIGWKKRRSENPPDAIQEGIRDGEIGAANPYYLSHPLLRKHYLNGYQCGFRSRRCTQRGNDRHLCMGDSFIAMHEARYPHDIPPPMA